MGLNTAGSSRLVRAEPRRDDRGHGFPATQPAGVAADRHNVTRPDGPEFAVAAMSACGHNGGDWRVLATVPRQSSTGGIRLETWVAYWSYTQFLIAGEAVPSRPIVS